MKGLMPDYAKIRNTGDTPFDDGQTGHPYTVPPNAEVVVPWNVMCVWLGDPEARDSQKNPVRQEERSRLHLRYGVTSGIAGDKRPGWADAMPKLVAYSLTGDPLPTVAADPDGTLFPTAAPILDENSIASQIASLQQALEDLQARATPSAAAIAQSESSRPGVAADPQPDIVSEPPVDAPRRGRVAKAKSDNASSVPA